MTSAGIAQIGRPTGGLYYEVIYRAGYSPGTLVLNTPVLAASVCAHIKPCNSTKRLPLVRLQSKNAIKYIAY